MRLADRLTIASLATALLLSPSARAGGDAVFGDGFEAFQGIEIATPDIVVQPGEAGTVCYYFRMPNTGTVGVRRWSSTLGAGVHHAILYTTHDSNWNPAEHEPPGTVSHAACGFSGVSGLLGWQYIAHHPAQQLVIPDDDGAGQPLAMELVAGQAMVLQLYIPNMTVEPITTNATVRANLLPAGAPYTRTATYMTFNGSFVIPPMAVGAVAQNTCAVPAGVKFWHLSTRTHRRGVLSELQDQATTLVSSTNWQDPAATVFGPPAFYTFNPTGVTYRCAYNNPDTFQVGVGDDQTNDEQCVGIGYFFPATRPSICINSTGPL